MTTLGLVSCGGGNDVASSGASAVSAAAPVTTTASAPSTTTATEPKVNGQVDERTGVAPVAAQMTIVPKPTGSYGCFQGDEGGSVMGVVDFGTNTMNGAYRSSNGTNFTYSISFTFSGGPIYHAKAIANEGWYKKYSTSGYQPLKSFDFDFDFMFIDSGRTLNLQLYQDLIIPYVCQRQ